ncbi:alpha/beta fold hydrolase [Almyronema epifaneia]|uniref:Alpha/beta fold hydrolase n=1 Tax=Almyronema epifaneia S1 TaxID=2991925 RepID=A0ABW6I975_9CYAN
MPSTKSKICLLRLTAARPHLPVLLFLPGMDGTEISLRPQLAGLQAHFDIRCLTLPPDDHSDWPTLARITIDLVKQANLFERSIYLCGESFGGCLALQIAADYPHLFERLILINPASSFSNHLLMGWGAELLPPLPYYLYYISAFGLLPFLAAFDRIEVHNSQALLAAMQAVTQTSARWRLKLLNTFRPNWTRLRQLHQPTLLLASRADRLLPSITEAEKLQRAIPHAQMVVLPHSGHACLLERQVKLAAILQTHKFMPALASDPLKERYDESHKGI